MFIVNANSLFSIKIGCMKSELIDKKFDKICFMDSSNKRRKPPCKPMKKKKKTMMNMSISKQRRAAAFKRAGSSQRHCVIVRKHKSPGVSLFKKLQREPEGVLIGQPMIFKKRNNLIFSCICNLKHDIDLDHNEFITVFCYIEKCTQPKAEILVKKTGTILGNNGSTCSILQLDEVNLSEEGKVSDIRQVLNTSSAAIKEILNLTKKAPLRLTSAELLQARMSNNTVNGGNSGEETHRQRKVRLPPVAQRSNCDQSKYSVILPGARTSLYIEKRYPLNVDKKTVLLELTRHDLSLSPKETGQIENPDPKYSKEELKDESRPMSRAFSNMDVNDKNMVASILGFTSKNVRYNNGFFFRLNHNFEFEGGFIERYSHHASNLDLTGIHSNQLNRHGKVLYNFLNQNVVTDDFKTRIDYSKGIRVKRLNGDDYLLDWYQGMDDYNDSEDSGEGLVSVQNNYQRMIEEEKKMREEQELRKQLLNARNSLKAGQTSENEDGSATTGQANLSPPSKVKQNFQAFKQLKGVGSSRSNRLSQSIRSLRHIMNTGKRAGQAASQAESRRVSLYRKMNDMNKEDFDNESDIFLLNMNRINSMANKRQLSRAIRSRGLRCPIKATITIIALLTLILMVSVIYWTIDRSTISQDLELFAKLDYAARFRNSDFYNIESQLNDICLMNNGTDLFVNWRAGVGLSGGGGVVDKALEINKRKLAIQGSLESFENLSEQMSDTIYGLTKSKPFLEEITTEKIQVYRGSEFYKIESLVDATTQLTSAIYNILQLDTSEITFEQPDVDFVFRNLRGDLLQKFIDFVFFPAQIREDVFKRQASSQNHINIVLLTLLGILVPSLYIVSYCYYRQREQFVEQFYGFKRRGIRQIIKNLEFYQEFLQLHQFDETQQANLLFNNSDEEAEEDGEGRQINGKTGSLMAKGAARMGMEEMIMRLKKRKKKKGSLVPWCGCYHLALILSVMLVILGRFSTYEYQNQIVANTDDLLKITEMISLSETINYCALITIEMSTYDFGQFGYGYLTGTLRTERNRYAEFSWRVNDDSLKVRSGGYVSFPLFFHSFFHFS